MRKIVVLLSFFLSLAAYAQPQTKIDHNLTSSGGYGYLLSEDNLGTVWWAEGVYKVLRNAPIPRKTSNEIALFSAKNEWESFQVVINPKVQLDKVCVSLSPLTSSSGAQIGQESLVVRKVEYVNITRPTDSFASKGEYPDPLPRYTQPETLYKAKNQPFWVSVKVPENALAADYKGVLTVSSGDWKQEIPVTLCVWNFVLPSTPTMRSGFGMSMDNIVKYDNLGTQDQKAEGFENYMKAFRDYKISPYDPFLLHPIKEEVTGVPWMGGFFDSQHKRTGAYAIQVVDNSVTENIECSYRGFIPVSSDSAYRLKWWTKNKTAAHPFVVGVECYDADRKLLVFENRFDSYNGTLDWKEYSMTLGQLDPRIKYLKIRLYSTLRTLAGSDVGTVWFDDLALTSDGDSKNIFADGGFEVDLDKIDIKLDFDDFNQAAKKYFGEYGFNAYRLRLKGLGGGTYFSRQKGVFEGFEQGTSEYNKLMQKYLMQIQANLEKNGLLGKEYIYWFDEPGEPDYPFVYETNAMIKKFAPKLRTFLTEHISGQDISDVTDISCTIWHQMDHSKIKKMNDKGLEYWSYLCVWPKAPWISEFIDHDAINMRMWLWASYVHKLKGILIWETTYWNSETASPAGYLQNPWDEPMSFVTGYGYIHGKQTIWGNGDGRFFYPLNRDPNGDRTTHLGEAIPSLRLETLRDGIEDYEYLVLLDRLQKAAPADKAKSVAALLQIPQSIYTNEKTYAKDPRLLLDYRKKLAAAIVELSVQR
ncbi:MAG: DUF4091 domain-containing protein [Mucinivorans sp.]